VDNYPEGTRLGHYILGKLILQYTLFNIYNTFFYVAGKALGKGTFGKVKLANHTLTKEKVGLITVF